MELVQQQKSKKLKIRKDTQLIKICPPTFDILQTEQQAQKAAMNITRQDFQQPEYAVSFNRIDNGADKGATKLP